MGEVLNSQACPHFSVHSNSLSSPSTECRWMMHACPSPHHWGRESWHLQWGSQNGTTPECHFESFLSICIFSSGWTKKRKVKVLVAQSCLTLCDFTDHSLPGSSVDQILQARILEWVAIAFSRGSFWPRDQTQVTCIAGRFFTIWATRETEWTKNRF